MTQVSTGGPYIAREVHEAALKVKDGIILELFGRIERIEAEVAQLEARMAQRHICKDGEVVKAPADEPRLKVDTVNNKLVPWSDELEKFFEPWSNLGLDGKIPMCEAMASASWIGLFVARTPELRLTRASVQQSDGIAVDRNGVALRIGQLVKVHQEEGTRTGIVVDTFPLNKTCTATGCWVDVNIEGRGPEGIPSYILEVEQASPAAWESPGISPDPAQAHGPTTPATPSAAVGANEPGAGISLRDWCQKSSGTRVPEPSDSKPTNCINPESEDTPPRGNDAPATGKPFQLEHGKQYLRRDGKVSGVMTQTKGGEYSVSHPLWDDFHCLSYRPDGRYNVSEAEDKFDLISEYHEPEPIPPAELHPVDRLRRELDAAVEYHDNYTSKIDKALGQPRHGGDLLTEHLREIERLTYLPQTASPPAESPPLPSPWRPMSEKPPTDSWVWLAWTSSKHVSVYRHENIWLAPSYAIAWMPATPPTHPKAPPVVPKTRTITLREYSLFEGTSSAVRSWTEIIPGLPWKDTCRTFECEVPE